MKGVYGKTLRASCRAHGLESQVANSSLRRNWHIRYFTAIMKSEIPPMADNALPPHLIGLTGKTSAR